MQWEVITDELLSKARELTPKPPGRELDMLVTTGERISMSLLGIALHRIMVDAISLTGSQCGILTNEHHGNARISEIQGHRIRTSFKSHQVVLVAGFQGVSPVTKDITSLGRGGSDLTAIALSIAMGLESCQIYTDVNGVYTCDPRVVPAAIPLPKISWSRMSAMAHAGAGIFHHRAARLAERYQLQVEIRNSSRPEEVGTTICGNLYPSGGELEAASVTGMACKNHQVLVELGFDTDRQEDSPFDVLAQCLQKLEDLPPLFLLVRGKKGLEGHFLLMEENVHDFKLEAQAVASRLGQVISFHTVGGLAQIAVVGTGFLYDSRPINKIKSCIKEIPVHCFEVKDHEIVVVVGQNDLRRCVQLLHKNLIENN